MSATLARPGACQGCGAVRGDLMRCGVHGGRWTCQRCYQATQTFAYPGCGERKRIPSARKDADGRPVRCADCVTADEDVDRFVAIAWEVAGVEPDLAADAVVAAIETAAPTVVEQRILATNQPRLLPGRIALGRVVGHAGAVAAGACSRTPAPRP